MVCVDRVERDYISNPNFRPDYIRTKSSAAAGLCAWVINICKYFRIYQVGLSEQWHIFNWLGRLWLSRSSLCWYLSPSKELQAGSQVQDMQTGGPHASHLTFPPPLQVVAPKRAALADANKRLDGANKKLSGIRARVKDLQDRVAALEENLMRATEDKNAAVAAVRNLAVFTLNSCSRNCFVIARKADGPPKVVGLACLLNSQGLAHGPVTFLLCPAGRAHSQQGRARAAVNHWLGERVRALDGEHTANGGHRGQPSWQCADQLCICHVCRRLQCRAAAGARTGKQQQGYA